ncbi:MAG TPA: hypothetical protein PKE21_01125 [Flavobacteriales bacterium]|nr:hypothetical protein [Flavobacteriales bacterium]HMR26054.1 hypothetical protein [Flavobacteriales bacterium]
MSPTTGVRSIAHFRSGVKPLRQPFRKGLVYPSHPIAMGTLRARPGNRSQLILTGGVLSAILSVLSFLLAYIVL